MVALIRYGQRKKNVPVIDFIFVERDEERIKFPTLFLLHYIS